MAEQNKVHFGLKNVHYALITYTSGVPSWGTPKAVPLQRIRRHRFLCR